MALISTIISTEDVKDCNVFVPHHPLIKHLGAVLKNKETPPALFRNTLAELGRLLIYEATRDWMPMVSKEIQSPLGVATTVESIDLQKPVVVVPILRAGLALAELAPAVLPASITYHLGMRRDELTLQPSTYLNKLPNLFPEGAHILLMDSVLATGGTIIAAIDLLKERGVTNKQIKVITAIAARPSLAKISKQFPGLTVYTGMIDPILNDKGWIIPGLGDAGDRSFGTEK